MRRDVVRSWNREYERGRYLDEPPVAFVHDIVNAASDHGIHGRLGLYIGCGNGRNYAPLVKQGLDLVGLDISPVAIRQLAKRSPELRHRLICGDLQALDATCGFSLVVGIQVFQHGTREITHEHIRAAQAHVAPLGLIAVRVNAVETDVAPDHEVVECADDGGFTVRYSEGPKRGLDVHFFSAAELEALFEERFSPVVPLRKSATERQPPQTGRWIQWEAIWKARPSEFL